MIGNWCNRRFTDACEKAGSGRGFVRLLNVDNREQIHIVRTPPRRPLNRVDGGVPEWLKGTGCKPVGYAYVGSNPTPSTKRAMTCQRRGAEDGARRACPGWLLLVGLD